MHNYAVHSLDMHLQPCADTKKLQRTQIFQLTMTRARLGARIDHDSRRPNGRNRDPSPAADSSGHTQTVRVTQCTRRTRPE
eukprot:5758945-Prymnesium_polylepis.1